MDDDIEQLRDAMRRIAALGVKQVNENLGIAAVRMAFMRCSLEAVLRGDFTMLEIAERVFSDNENMNHE